MSRHRRQQSGPWLAADDERAHALRVGLRSARMRRHDVTHALCDVCSRPADDARTSRGLVGHAACLAERDLAADAGTG